LRKRDKKYFLFAVHDTVFVNKWAFPPLFFVCRASKSLALPQLLAISSRLTHNRKISTVKSVNRDFDVREKELLKYNKFNDAAILSCFPDSTKYSINKHA
jgi:hypothetical protein